MNSGTGETETGALEMGWRLWLGPSMIGSLGPGWP